jgi:hypothetical protein
VAWRGVRTYLSGQTHELSRSPASIIGPDLRLDDDGARSSSRRAQSSPEVHASRAVAVTQQGGFFDQTPVRAQRSRVRSRGRERRRGCHRGGGRQRVDDALSVDRPGSTDSAVAADARKRVKL